MRGAWKFFKCFSSSHFTCIGNHFLTWKNSELDVKVAVSVDVTFCHYCCCCWWWWWWWWWYVCLLLQLFVLRWWLWRACRSCVVNTARCSIHSQKDSSESACPNMAGSLETNLYWVSVGVVVVVLLVVVVVVAAAVVVTRSSRCPTRSRPSISVMPPGVICATIINDGVVLLSRVMPNPKLTPASGFVNVTSNNSP